MAGFKSEYLDLAIALAVVFFLASIVVSGLNEGVQWLFRIRAKFLWAFLHDLTDPQHSQTGHEKALPRGRSGILKLVDSRNDRRPIVEGIAPASPSGTPANLLQRLACALDPIDAPQLTGGTTKRQTAVSHVPAVSLAQAFLEVFAEVGRQRMDAAVLAMATALGARKDPDAATLLQLSEGLGDRPEAREAFTEAVKSFVSDVTAAGDDNAAQAAGQAFGQALEALPGARPGFVTGDSPGVAGASLATAIHTVRPAAGAASVDAVVLAAVQGPARKLSSAIIRTFPEGFSRQRIDVAVAGLDGSPMGPTARRLWESAEGRIDTFRTSLEAWIDSEMIRLGGYYKRSIRLFLIAFAVVVALTLNIDAIQLTRDLWRNPDGRAKLVTLADRVLDEPAPPTTTSTTPSSRAGAPASPEPALTATVLTDLRKKCVATTPPQGASGAAAAPPTYQDVRACVTDGLNSLSGLSVIDRALWVNGHSWAADWKHPLTVRWLLHLFGVAGTAAALMLGAPFWFDLIKRLTGLRRGLVGQT